MKYLIILFLLVSLQSKSQEKKHAHIDLVISGGGIYPVQNKWQKYIAESTKLKTSNGYITEVGFDLMAGKGNIPFFFTFGSRLGYMSFNAKDSSHTYYGSTIHGNFSMGFNYINRSAAQKRIRIGLTGGAGFRADGDGDFGSNPYFSINASATQYFSNIGLGVSASYFNSINAVYINNQATRRYNSVTCNILSIAAEIRISLGRNRKKEPFDEPAKKERIIRYRD